MKFILAEQAMLADGWGDNVLIEIDDAEFIAALRVRRKRCTRGAVDNPPPAETPLIKPENLSKCLGPPLERILLPLNSLRSPPPGVRSGAKLT